MVNINMVTTGALNRDSIQSINIADPQSVKNQGNITTLIKPPKYGQPQQGPQGSPVSQPRYGQPHAAILPTPKLLNKIQKGQKTALSQTPPDAISACFGWNTTDARCDVDVSAFMLGSGGKVIGDAWFVFYGQTMSPDKSTEFSVDGTADRERIRIDFRKLDANVQKIVFVLTINEALEKHLDFGMMKDAYVRILDASGRELVSFMMTEYYSNVISMMIGELYLHNGAWKFNAVGNGVAKDLPGLCSLYGVQVID